MEHSVVFYIALMNASNMDANLSVHSQNQAGEFVQPAIDRGLFEALEPCHVGNVEAE